MVVLFLACTSFISLILPTDHRHSIVPILIPHYFIIPRGQGVQYPMTRWDSHGWGGGKRPEGPEKKNLLIYSQICAAWQKCDKNVCPEQLYRRNLDINTVVQVPFSTTPVCPPSNILFPLIMAFGWQRTRVVSSPKLMVNGNGRRKKFEIPSTLLSFSSSLNPIYTQLLHAANNIARVDWTFHILYDGLPSPLFSFLPQFRL